MSQKIRIETRAHSDALKGTVILYAAEGPVLEGRAKDIWSASGLDLAAVAKTAGFTGKQGQVLDILAVPNGGANRLVVLGLGKRDDVAARSITGLRDRGGSLAGKFAGLRVDELTVVLDGLSATSVAHLLSGVRLRHYKFDKYRTKTPRDEDSDAAKELRVIAEVDDTAACDREIAEYTAVAEGTLLARDLVNEPSNALGPNEFAEVIRGLAKQGVEVEILDVAQMEKLGMGALLAVGRGSSRPARLGIMQWHGGKKGDAPLVFVGKGVVFDTGGISLKPGASMEDMKGDMGGAAAVTGLMHALSARKAKCNVVGIVGLAENMPDGDAYRPGDIVTSMSGQTIEIINTDAEGRLVLADALWYGQERFKPKFMFDLATLTGAIVVGLGSDYAGLFSNNDEIATKLYDAGLASGEKVWRMPLGAAYDKLIDSRFADMKNIGGRQGGAITAAQFLQRFVNDTPWAHIDIAGPAFGTASTEINTSWASGFGVGLLDQLVRDNFENQ